MFFCDDCGNMNTPQTGSGTCDECGAEYEIDREDAESDEFEVSPDDTLFEKNQIQKPQYYREHAERLGLSK